MDEHRSGHGIDVDADTLRKMALAYHCRGYGGGVKPDRPASDGGWLRRPAEDPK